jgi:hypothetical protein
MRFTSTAAPGLAAPALDQADIAVDHRRGICHVERLAGHVIHGLVHAPAVAGVQRKEELGPNLPR